MSENSILDFISSLSPAAKWIGGQKPMMGATPPFMSTDAQSYTAPSLDDLEAMNTQINDLDVAKEQRLRNQDRMNRLETQLGQAPDAYRNQKLAEIYNNKGKFGKTMAILGEVLSGLGKVESPYQKNVKQINSDFELSRKNMHELLGLHKTEDQSAAVQERMDMQRQQSNIQNLLKKYNIQTNLEDKAQQMALKAQLAQMAAAGKSVDEQLKLVRLKVLESKLKNGGQIPKTLNGYLAELAKENGWDADQVVKVMKDLRPPRNPLKLGEVEGFKDGMPFVENVYEGRSTTAQPFKTAAQLQAEARAAAAAAKKGK